jgi:hypothetical protein
MVYRFGTKGKFLTFFELQVVILSQSLHFTPRQVVLVKTASIAQLVIHQTFPQYYLSIWQLKFSIVCLAIPLSTVPLSCHRNLWNSPVSLTFVNQFSHTGTPRPLSNRALSSIKLPIYRSYYFWVFYMPISHFPASRFWAKSCQSGHFPAKNRPDMDVQTIFGKFRWGQEQSGQIDRASVQTKSAFPGSSFTYHYPESFYKMRRHESPVLGAWQFNIQWQRWRVVTWWQLNKGNY